MSFKPVTRTVKTDQERKQLIRYLEGLPVPMTLQIKPGEESRSLKQNRLAFQWFKDAAAQGDQTVEQYRAECKLRLGVPILRRDDDDFRAKYDSALKPLSYENKLVCMEFFPVTSLMKTVQMTEFLNAVLQHFLNQGFVMTDPSLLGMDDWRAWVK
jgi:hypothetical protein